MVEAEQGDTLLDLLQKAGVERTEATKAIDALREVYNPKALRVGQEITVTFERPADGIGSGPFDAVALQPDAGHQVTAKRGKEGFSAREVKREVSRQLAHFNGTIKGSLFEAATTQGVPAPILAELIRAFSYDVDFQRDIQPGDRFEVMFERFVDKKGQVVRDGDILFANLILSGEAMPIYRYVDSSGAPDYYNPKGESVRKALLRTPVDGARISSGYGMRMHPILGFSKMHKGVDFAVASGTPVMAAGAGIIDYAGANGSYGYYVRIKHDAAHSTAYAHLSRFAQGIRTGKHVAQGQIVASLRRHRPRHRPASALRGAGPERTSQSDERQIPVRQQTGRQGIGPVPGGHQGGGGVAGANAGDQQGRPEQRRQRAPELTRQAPFSQLPVQRFPQSFGGAAFPREQGADRLVPFFRQLPEGPALDFDGDPHRPFGGRQSGKSQANAFALFALYQSVFRIGRRIDDLHPRRPLRVGPDRRRNHSAFAATAEKIGDGMGQRPIEIGGDVFDLGQKIGSLEQPQHHVGQDVLRLGAAVAEDLALNKTSQPPAVAADDLDQPTPIVGQVIGHACRRLRHRRGRADHRTETPPLPHFPHHST